MEEQKSFFKSNRILSSVSSLGFGASAFIGACGGACTAAAFPMGALFASLGLGSLAIVLVKLRIPLLVMSAIFGLFWIRNLVKQKRKVPAAITAIGLGFALIFVSLQIFFPMGVFHSNEKAAITTTNLDTLKDEFNKNSHKVRIVSLLSPGCDVCQRAHKETIAKTFHEISAENLYGINVWMPWVWGDSKDLAAVVAARLKDPRVSEFWDEKYELSTALTKTLKATQEVWDIYLIYPAGVKWTDEIPPSPGFMMHQLPEKYGLDMDLHLNADAFIGEVRKLTTTLAAD